MTLPVSFPELQKSYQSKATTPSQVVTALSGEIKKSKLNAFISVCDSRALNAAKALEAKPIDLKAQPLYGVPLGVKDAIQVAGVRTTCASKILGDYVAPFSATVIERLEKAGAIVVGKLNMDEFAMGSSNENSAFGPVIHPTHPGYVPGGSSGGSACSVKAGLAMAALGSDTGGSVRLPASFCGVVGLKTTYGRVSRYGLVAYGSSLDQIGPLAHTIEDVATVYEVMAGHDLKDSTSAAVAVKSWDPKRGVKGLKIGVPKEFFADGLQAEVKTHLEEALKFYKDQGAVLVDVELPHTKYSIPVYYVIAVSEASSNLSRFDGVRYGARGMQAAAAGKLEEFYETTRSLFGSEVKRRILLGTFALSSGYYDAYFLKACKVRRLIREDYLKAFQKCDVIAGPASPTTAFKLGEKTTDPLTMYLADIFTVPANLAGVPVLCLPCGADKAGLPIGMQLIGPHFSEDLLFSVGAAFQNRGSKA